MSSRSPSGRFSVNQSLKEKGLGMVQAQAPPPPQEQWQPPLPDEGVKAEPKEEPQEKVLSEYERFMAEVHALRLLCEVFCSPTAVT